MAIAIVKPATGGSNGDALAANVRPLRGEAQPGAAEVSAGPGASTRHDLCRGSTPVTSGESRRRTGGRSPAQRCRTPARRAASGQRFPSAPHPATDARVASVPGVPFGRWMRFGVTDAAPYLPVPGQELG